MIVAPAAMARIVNGGGISITEESWGEIMPRNAVEMPSTSIAIQFSRGDGSVRSSERLSWDAMSDQPFLELRTAAPLR